MAMECTSGKMETDTKESGNFVSNMVREQICLLTGTPILDSTLMENQVVLDSINGKIHPSM
jgi:hypothetical protein